MTRRHLSLQAVFTFAFLAVAAIPVWLAWQWPQKTAIAHEKKIARQAHVVNTNIAALALKQYHTAVTTTFGMFADELQNHADAQVIETTGALEAFRFNHICNFDAATGRLTGSFVRADRPCPTVPPAERLALIRSLSTEGKVRISDAMTAPDGTPMFLMVRRNGPMVTVGSLGTDYFRTMGKTITFGKNGHLIIVDRTGKALAHPDPEWETSLKDLTTLQPFGAIMEDVLAGNVNTGEFLSPTLGVEMVTTYRSVAGPGWGILVNQPLVEIESVVPNIRRETLGVLTLALAIAAALALLASHFLLDPLNRMRVAAERLGHGDGDALIAATGAGARLTEINDLRAAFNAMVLRIRRSHRMEIAARKEAQEATRVKTRFLANMSHELRTPLNAIIGFAEVTRRRMKGPDQERDREYVGYIHDSGHHLLAIINDLLDLSRIEAGARALEEEDVDLGAIILETRGMLGTMALDKNIEVVLTNTDRGMILRADRRAIKQILLNLATNAVRYTEPGGRVEIGCYRDEGGAVSLIVEDNGPGIDPEELENIRSPFTRGKSHETAAVPGTGLGLSIVDALVDMHGARLDVITELGEGTKAKIVFAPSRSPTILGDAKDLAAQ